MAALTALPYDLVTSFDALLGTGRGSQAQTERDLAPFLIGLAAGELEPSLLRLRESYFEDHERLQEGEPMGRLLDAFAAESARQAVERWRPHLPFLLRDLGVQPNADRLRRSLENMHDWVVSQMTMDYSMFLEDGDLDWNASFANARIGEGLSFVLAPLFRAAPKKRVSAVVGEVAYKLVDQRCRNRWGCPAAVRSGAYDVTTWGKVFDMLVEEGCDLQPGQVDTNQLRSAFAATFTNLLDGEY